MVRKVVDLHEKTVQKAARGEFKKPRKNRTGSKSGRVVTTQALDPALVQWMRSNHVSMRDVDVISPTTIIVR